MIHSRSGGRKAHYEDRRDVLVPREGGEKRWFISPFPLVKVGDGVQVPGRASSERGEVLKVERVTKQTAPFPVNRTREIERIL